MATYKVSVKKVLEDGTEVEVFRDWGEGWYISPWLQRLAKKYYEPRPKPELPGQLSLIKAPRPGGRNAA